MVFQLSNQRILGVIDCWVIILLDEMVYKDVIVDDICSVGMTIILNKHNRIRCLKEEGMREGPKNHNEQNQIRGMMK